MRLSLSGSGRVRAHTLFEPVAVGFFAVVLAHLGSPLATCHVFSELTALSVLFV